MMPQSLSSHINDINVDFEKENILNGSYELKVCYVCLFFVCF